jgi:hypothetical protein
MCGLKLKMEYKDTYYVCMDAWRIYRHGMLTVHFLQGRTKSVLVIRFSSTVTIFIVARLS